MQTLALFCDNAREAKAHILQQAVHGVQQVVHTGVHVHQRVELFWALHVNVQVTGRALADHLSTVIEHSHEAALIEQTTGELMVGAARFFLWDCGGGMNTKDNINCTCNMRFG